MPEARPNVHRRRLGSALRSLRRAAGLSMEEAADRLALSGKPTLSKIENGKQRVQGLALTAFLEVYGVREEATRQAIKAMATLAASGRRTSLLDEYREAVVTEGFEEYLHLEELACATEGYLTVVPGLLQTEDYALSIVERSQVWPSRREVARFVELRMARQAALTRETPLTFACILDEAALRRVVGGRAVMKAQLERLLEVTEQRNNVDVRVLPFDVGAHASSDGPFQLLHFSAGPPVVVIEGKTRSVYLEEAGDVDRYRSALDSLTEQTLPADQTRRFISDLIKDCYS
ncbi:MULTISPECIES: helix-turn-helix domain-containing protein [Streptomyces]|uniref:helix-turn-helix domain-containing protein n=1 Tax=Streptomyces TaxID=1883 RepID=UPI002E2ADC99|nr:MULTISPECIES: helix-turn-helix transcriptional regulator [Streptomyces]